MCADTHSSQHLQVPNVEGDVEERHEAVDELEQGQLDDAVVVELFLRAVVLCQTGTGGSLVIAISILERTKSPPNRCNRDPNCAVCRRFSGEIRPAAGPIRGECSSSHILRARSVSPPPPAGWYAASGSGRIVWPDRAYQCFQYVDT